MNKNLCGRHWEPQFVENFVAIPLWNIEFCHPSVWGMFPAWESAVLVSFGRSQRCHCLCHYLLSNQKPHLGRDHNPRHHWTTFLVRWVIHILDIIGYYPLTLLASSHFQNFYYFPQIKLSEIPTNVVSKKCKQRLNVTTAPSKQKLRIKYTYTHALVLSFKHMWIVVAHIHGQRHTNTHARHTKIAHKYAHYSDTIYP